MWFIFALITAAAWGGADLFYKKGTDPLDKYSHLKIVVAVGLVMGLHASVYWALNYTTLSFGVHSMLLYLPVSMLYIISMALGYAGLRYLELSIASPLQNASGAVTVVLCYIFFSQKPTGLQVAGTALIFIGIIGVAIWEKMQENQGIKASLTKADTRYYSSFSALVFPLAYCVIDALGTFADGLYLDEYVLIGEGEALLAYEFTFFICAVLVYIFLRVKKKERMSPLKEKDKFTAAALETAGQFFYVFAMSGNAMVAAPLVASYSILSVVFSHVFLKEKLTKAQYAAIVLVLAGVAILGLAEEVL
ncbi:DMT family transporter [Ruminococcaceae bacterium OttesenSCG-928-N02]|nr:DMT family transporter [Ruminococcaceae bacterium OttesenSCG-928-N02]